MLKVILFFYFVWLLPQECIFSQDSKNQPGSINKTSPFTIMNSRVVKDSSTGLLWTRQDSKNGLTWSQAISYCEDLVIDGLDQWYLPTIENLTSLGKHVSKGSAKDIPGFSLSSPWIWSSTIISQEGGVWYYHFEFGKPRRSRPGSPDIHVLCVYDSRRTAAVTWAEEPVDLPVRPFNPVIGPDDAPVTLIQFIDFGCPYCKRAQPIIKKIKEKYGNLVKIVFKSFPLPKHAGADIAAEAFLCAADQNISQEYQKHLFANQFAWELEDLVKIAERLKLNQSEFRKCLLDGLHSQHVIEDISDAQTAGITATPSYLVNGHLFKGTPSLQTFFAIIDSEIRKAGKTGK